MCELCRRNAQPFTLSKTGRACSAGSYCAMLYYTIVSAPRRHSLHDPIRLSITLAPWPEACVWVKAIASFVAPDQPHGQVFLPYRAVTGSDKRSL